MRQGDVLINPGYDGAYGIIKIFTGKGSPKSNKSLSQKALF